MFTAFWSALSSLNANSSAIDTIGHNLANVNTVGFKASDVAFRDLVSQSYGVGSRQLQIGVGTSRPITVRHFTQGAIQTSSGALDAAIQGDGFFVVKGPGNAELYTRNGSFQVDKAGNLITITGENVQGWTAANGIINANAPRANLALPAGQLRPAVATTNFSQNVNLNASVAVGTPAAAFSVPLEVIDSLGSTHVLNVLYEKTAANAWHYTVTIPGEDLTTGTAGTPELLTEGDLTFDSQGTLLTPDVAGGDLAVDISGLVSGAADMNLTWSLYDGATPRLTQYNQSSAPSAVSQDGLPAAQLLQVAMDDGGRVVARFSNGEQIMIGQLAIALIRNPESLTAAGDNNFVATFDTDERSYGAADTGGRGKIVGGALESSTVDIAREFTNLIVYQRAYQANSRVISTVDELSQEVINLKR